MHIYVIQIRMGSRSSMYLTKEKELSSQKDAINFDQLSVDLLRDQNLLHFKVITIGFEFNEMLIEDEKIASNGNFTNKVNKVQYDCGWKKLITGISRRYYAGNTNNHERLGELVAWSSCTIIYLLVIKSSISQK
ncbi:unnamed protein product [Lactuca saligna]|uniref:Uncharacterized protein n=1 Tax=Lactuca saligna TaxID=75948 RepID=A0AA35ZKW0_LACSI|nr:unnamed protein product [Lactuca saligna]